MQCLFRIPRKGGRVLWEITNRCNYCCKYCIFSAGENKRDKELTLEDCKRVVDDLYEHEFKEIKFTGGEPFLRADFIDILEYVASKGIKADVSTNAACITKDVAARLSKISLSMIHISLDGDNKEIHERIRGNHTYEPTIRGIKLLKKTNIYLRIGTVLYKGNQNRIKEIIKKVIELGVHEIIFSIMEPVGRMSGDNSEVITKSLKELEDEITSYQQKYQDHIKIGYNWNPEIAKHIKECPAGKQFLYINNKGNLAPCSWLVTISSKYLTQGSLKNKSLEELYKDPNWKNFIEKKQGGDCLGKHCEKTSN